MNKAVIIGGVLVGAVVLYMLFKKPQAAPSATGVMPINALPARAYALNNNYNPQGQPPPATFAPFSGVPFVEGLTGLFSGSAPVAGNANISNPDLSTIAAAASAPVFSGSGGSGFGGAGTDVGPATTDGYS